MANRDQKTTTPLGTRWPENPVGGWGLWFLCYGQGFYSSSIQKAHNPRKLLFILQLLSGA